MVVQSLCRACGKPNLEQARYCEDCGAVLQEEATAATSEDKPVPHASTYYYTSTYQTARATAYFISGVGWVITVISVLMFLVGISEGGLAGLLFLPSLGGVIGGLLLIGVGQFSRAAVDTADFTGEMLAIMKATWISGKQS